MRKNSFSLQRTLSVAAALVGFATISGLPAKAQVNSGSGQSPNGVTQPNNTAPINTAPTNTAPTNTAPTNTAPSNTAPSNTAPTNIPSAPTTPNTTPATPGANTPAITAPTTNAPATSAPAANAPAATNDRYLAELLTQAAGTGSFSTLARAVEAAGVGDTLRETGEKFTIFAPTDEAFAALPPDVLERLLRPENRDLLREVLAYHVVPGAVSSKDLRTGLIDTLGGGIAVRVTPDRIIVNDGSVVQPDIQAANGVIHVVNRVLMPEQLRQRLVSLR